MTLFQDQMKQHVYSFEDKAERKKVAKDLVIFATTLAAELDGKGRFKIAWFEEFWAAYPPNRHVGKQAALRKYQALLRSGTNHEAITSGARQYALSVRGKEKDYIAHPTTWLNAGRWDDELDVSSDLPQEIQDRLIRDEKGRFYYRKDDERIYV